MSSNCPKCAGRDWKSAKLVIFEGTTKTEGFLEGRLGGRDSANNESADFLLADRWFNAQKPITAEFGTTTTSILVDEIKNLLVSEGAIRPMPEAIGPLLLPEKPEEPRKLARDKGKLFAVEPKKTAAPTPPEKPRSMVGALGVFPSKSLSQVFWGRASWSAIWLAFLLVIISYFFPELLGQWLKFVTVTLDMVPTTHPFSEQFPSAYRLEIPFFSLWMKTLSLGDFTISLIALSISFGLLWISRCVGILLTLKAGERARRKKYDLKLEKAQRAQEELDKKYAIALEKYETKARDRQADIEQFKTEQMRYREELASYDLAAEAARNSYKFKLAEYESQVAEVMLFRSELWERARMCTRCGNCYLGPRLIA